MKNIVAQTRYEYGTITNRPTANRLVTLTNNIFFIDFSGMTVSDIYESAPIDIEYAGQYTLYIQTYEYIEGATASVQIINNSTGATLASIGTLDFFSVSAQISIKKLTSFVLADPSRIHLKISVTGRTLGSVGYKMTIGDMIIYKEK